MWICLYITRFHNNSSEMKIITFQDVLLTQLWLPESCLISLCSERSIVASDVLSKHSWLINEIDHRKNPTTRLNILVMKRDSQFTRNLLHLFCKKLQKFTFSPWNRVCFHKPRCILEGQKVGSTFRGLQKSCTSKICCTLTVLQIREALFSNTFYFTKTTI